jgi:hypothetical protein
MIRAQEGERTEVPRRYGPGARLPLVPHVAPTPCDVEETLGYLLIVMAPSRFRPVPADIFREAGKACLRGYVGEGGGGRSLHTLSRDEWLCTRGGGTPLREDARAFGVACLPHGVIRNFSSPPSLPWPSLPPPQKK